MTDTAPGFRQPVVSPDGTITRPWGAWVQRVNDALNVPTVDAPAPIVYMAASTTLKPQMSLTGYGTLANGSMVLTLEGDAQEPGMTYAYGTDATGAKGWHPIADAFTATAGNVTLTTGADGVTDVDLATVADAGGGTLLRIVRDAWGRITGTSAPTNADVAPLVVTATITNGDNTHAPSGDAVFDALALRALIPKGYIDGLQMQWVSGTALTVSSGSAYIEASGNIVASPSAIAKAGLSLSASTWYHVYLYLNAGTPDIEIVTTAPIAYSGTARSKTGDASRRYLGSVRTNASSVIYNFNHSADSGLVGYKNVQSDATFRVLAAGTSTAETAVSLSSAVPVSALAASIRIINLESGPAVQFYTGTSDDSAAGPPYDGIAAVDPLKDAYIIHPLNSAQAMTYWYRLPTSGGGGYIDVYGYFFER